MLRTLRHQVLILYVISHVKNSQYIQGLTSSI